MPKPEVPDDAALTRESMAGVGSSWLTDSDGHLGLWTKECRAVKKNGGEIVPQPESDEIVSAVDQPRAVAHAQAPDSDAFALEFVVARPAMQKQIANKALTKTACFPLIKQNLKSVGVHINMQILARGVNQIRAADRWRHLWRPDLRESEDWMPSTDVHLKTLPPAVPAPVTHEGSHGLSA